jgi:hypothetical protein
VHTLSVKRALASLEKDAKAAEVEKVLFATQKRQEQKDKAAASRTRAQRVIDEERRKFLRFWKEQRLTSASGCDFTPLDTLGTALLPFPLLL